ncbi:MAG: outer membrane protein assembly factor BamD [Bdellovibrionales bacterium]|nr:outer membrane protein assembly factor BamD [Bdellovibrionales bacterium]
MKALKFGFSLILLACSCQIFLGCAGKTINENDPKELYEDADEDVKNDRFLLALDKLRVIKSKFSYSSYGALSQLRIGDVYFLQESYPEAASAYETFVELYPKHERAPYALFRAGESFFNDIPSTIARDLRSAESAVASFSLYLRRYPSGEHSIAALDLKKKAYNKLAEKEMEIAEFYIKRKKPASAKSRLEKILNLYTESDLASKARTLMEKLPSE